MDDDEITLGKACRHLSLDAVSLADLDVLKLGQAILDDKDRPAVISPKEAAHWEFQDALTLPNDDVSLDAVTVAEGATLFSIADEVDDDVDPLLFHAEGGDFGEGLGFDSADDAAKGFAAAPLLDESLLAGTNLDGVFA